MRTIALFLLLHFPTLSLADTIHVPGDYATIQGGIDAAGNGDVVLVAPGTYVENIDFLGKAITVKSSGGAEVTVVDGGNPAHPDYGSAVNFVSGESANSVLEGFTLTNGTGRIVAPGKHDGGGIYCGNSSPTITGNIITDNITSYAAGGVLISGSNPIFSNNVIHNNISKYGGGIELYGSDVTHFANNLIIENTGIGNTGGLLLHTSTVHMLCNTFYGNTSPDVGGLKIGHTSKAIIENCIFYENTTSNNREIYIENQCQLDLSYSNIMGGQAAVVVISGGILNWGAGMIDANPLFVDSINRNFRLQQHPCQPGVSNPCVDTGDPTSNMINGSTRTDGLQDSSVVDMGFHYPVDADDILMVPSEYLTIQAAIGEAQTGDTVLVAPGTYVENINFLGKAITVKSSHEAEITIIDGGCPVDPDWGSVVAFVNGEDNSSHLLGFTISNGTGSRLQLANQNYYGGGIVCKLSSPTIMNNKILNNSLSTHGGQAYGGAICCYDYSSPMIIDNEILNNSIGHYGSGGAIWCKYDSSPLILNNTIADNKVHPEGHGGAISCESSSSFPQIISNKIKKNSAVFGGGISCSWSDPIIHSNIIDSNSAKTGAGIYCDRSDASIFNNIILSNVSTTDNGGGILCSDYSFPVISNNTIFNNTANVYGGGIYIVWESWPKVNNTIIWNNYAPMGRQVALEGVIGHQCYINIDNTDVEGGQSSIHVEPNCHLNWGSGNIDTAPLFVDPTNNDFHLTYNSPCKDAGYNTAVTELFDFESDPRIAYGTVDMGADEFHPHLYYTGNATPGESIDLKFIGIPGDATRLWIGSGVLDPPIHHPVFGDWYLEAPILLGMILGNITADGVYTLPVPIPPDYTPWDIPLQAGIGMGLSNLCVVGVE